MSPPQADLTPTDTDLRYYSSTDGINWQPLEVNSERAPTVRSNTDVIFTTPDTILSESTEYLKIEFTGENNSLYRRGRVELTATPSGISPS